MSNVGCRRPATIRIGIQMSPAMALLMVAKDKHYFSDEGIDVTLQAFTAGKFALQAFLGGSLDFAVAGEVPVTLAMLQGSRFRVLTQVVERTRNEVRVVARVDGDLTTPEDYFGNKKRKIATSLGGGPEYFTYSFLKSHRIRPSQVQIVSQRPEDMPAALSRGDVDAIAIFDPFAYFAERIMGSRSLTFRDNTNTLYSELYVLTARQGKLTQEIPKFLAALVRAQNFIASNPEDAKRIVAVYTQLDRATLNAIWENFVFAPALTKRLLDYQQQEAAWAEEKGMIPPNASIPDFRKAIDPEYLRNIRSSAVEF